MLKEKAAELMTIFDKINDWIQLNIPAIQAEDNIGVEVQRACLQLIQACLTELKGYHDVELAYLNRRAQMETVLLQYPTCSSAILALEVYDANTWDDLEKSFLEMSRTCILAHSYLQKNMAKLRKPREDRSTLYAL